jgi:hypothetical protein
MTPESLNERYELAAKIVRLIEDLHRELLGGPSGGHYNWNYAVINGFTDSMEAMILLDVFGPLRAPTSGSKAVRTTEQDQIARDRIGKLFSENRLLVAELELSGMEYRA